MLRNALIKEVSSAAAGGVDVKLVEPDRSENGDFSTNVAFQIAKKMEKGRAELSIKSLIDFNW